MRRPTALLVLAATLSLAACGQNNPKPAAPDYATLPADAKPATGDVLTAALGADPTNLVSFLAGENAASTIASDIYQSLLTYDENLNLKGELAESWQVSNGGRTLTFTLRPGLTFADGSPLTSADVLATFTTIINPKTRRPYAGDYLQVKTAEAPDARTFRVTYPEAFAPALSSWAGLSILPKKEIDKTPDDFNATALKEQPLGSGPYSLTRWRRGQDILLSANRKAFNAPNISQLYYRILPDTASQWLELKAGNLDMADLTPLQFSRLTDAPWFTSRYNKLSWLSNAYTFLGFNLKNPLFQSKQVRQALSYAVDRQGIINAVLFGQGQPIAGVFKPGTWAYNPHIAAWPYDPAKARSMLAEQGWKPDTEGILRNAQNQPFTFTVTTNQGNDVRIKAAQIIQKELADLGITMHIRVQEWSSFITNTVKQRDFDAILLGWSLSIEPDPYDIWHSSKTKPDEFNMISYNNPEADKLMEQARREFNQPKRQALLWRFQEILADEQPYLWLYAPNAMVAVHKRVQGIRPTPAGIGFNQPEWYVPKAWQLRPAMQP